MNEKIFALDIGTRSVVGIMIEKVDNSFRVADMVTKEHTERSMLDGQIHDVLSVSRVILEVKEQLEIKHGPLKKVCVAAAGRALRTCRTSISESIHNHPLMSHDDVAHLELSAVQQAQYDLSREWENSKSTDYYCVGYSVLHYKLDGHSMGSLIDQQGHEVNVEIIATFLPKVVVESLLSALQRADLEMDALTLEPIAAIQVLIPQSMRRLNVALVDIGAGTSDIALTDHGTVTAYGMVPLAGDEITEAISDQYLLDFPLAEKAKREMTKGTAITITDILGFENEVSYEEIVEQIEPAIETLAEHISNEILSLNGKAPKAVMLVGGGSQTPELAAHIARKLNLPEQRVAIRGIDAIQNLEEKETLPEGPDFVTPIGIAIAAKQNPVHYISVKVNDRMIRLFDMKTLTIGDSLLSAGIDLKKLFGKPGNAFMVTINEQPLTLKGTFGTAPALQVNGNEASLESPIRHGDEIHVEKGMDGVSPDVSIEELIGELKPLNIYYNDRSYSLTDPVAFINGNLAGQNQLIKDRDRIEYFSLQTIQDLKKVLINIGDWIEPTSATSIMKINGEDRKLPGSEKGLTKNELVADLHTPINDGDHIRSHSNFQCQLKDVLHNDEFHEQIDVFFNDQLIHMKKLSYRIKRDQKTLTESDLVFPGDSLTSVKVETTPFIFQDIFRYVDIDISTISSRFQLYRNQEKTSFHQPIYSGDELSIKN